MTSARTVPLGDLLLSTDYGTSKKATSHGGEVPVIRMGNVTYEGDLNTADLKYLTREEIDAERDLLRVGDILFNRTNSRELVGKSALWDGRFEAVAASYFIRVRVDQQRVLPAFVAHWLNCPMTKRRLFNTARGAIGQANINTRELRQLPFPLLALEKQQEAVAALDRASWIVKLQMEALAKGRELIPALFFQMFGDPVRDEIVRLPLGQVAEVVSGLTKGRKLNGKVVRPAPYLRVANVQAGHLDLSEIKTIDATADEVRQLSLRVGDVLLTEGGDHDKLGRGALWRGEIEGCVHQNHVFRVRCHAPHLAPTYFDKFLLTNEAKNYFLRAAKRTTNLASINMTQLRALPVPLPPAQDQQRFTDAISGVERVLQSLSRAVDIAVAQRQGVSHSVFGDD